MIGENMPIDTEGAVPFHGGVGAFVCALWVFQRPTLPYYDNGLSCVLYHSWNRVFHLNQKVEMEVFGV